MSEKRIVLSDGVYNDDEQEAYDAGFIDGKVQGIAHERKRLLGDQKPDGWCAWHPTKGWLKPIRINDIRIHGELTGGYKDVPVKLVVLNETGGE